jgi:hypothetical protein
MAEGWRKFSTAELISAAYLAGQGKSGDEIASVLRVSRHSAYSLLHRYGVPLVPKQEKQCCVGPIVLHEDDVDASLALAAESGLSYERTLSLALGGLINDPITFKRIVKSEKHKRK